MSEFVLEIIEKGEFKPSCDFFRDSLTLSSDRTIKILGSVTSKGRNIINIKASIGSKFDTWSDALMWSDKIEANSIIVAFDYDSTLYFCNVAAPAPFVYPVRTSATKFDGMSICCLFHQQSGTLKLMGVKGDANYLMHSTEDDYQQACEFYVNLHAYSDMIYSIYPNDCNYDIRNYASFYKNLSGYAIMFGNDSMPSDEIFDKVFEKISVAEHKPAFLSHYANNNIDETIVRRRKKVVSTDEEEEYLYDDEDFEEDTEDAYVEEFDVNDEVYISIDDIDFGETAKFIPRDKNLLYKTFSHISLVNYLKDLIEAADKKLAESPAESKVYAEDGIDLFNNEDDEDEEGIDIFNNEDDDEDYVYDFDDDEEEYDYESEDAEEGEENSESNNSVNVPDRANSRHELDLLVILAIASNGMQSSDVFLQSNIAGLDEICKKTSTQLNSLMDNLLNSDDSSYKHVCEALKYEYHSLFSLCGYLSSGIIADGDISVMNSIINGTASLEAVMYFIEKKRGTSFVNNYRKYLSVDHLLKPAVKANPKFKYPFGYNMSKELLNNFVLINAVFRDLDTVSEHTYVSDIYNLVAAPNHMDKIKTGFNAAVYSNAYLLYLQSEEDPRSYWYATNQLHNSLMCIDDNSSLHGSFHCLSGVFKVAIDNLGKSKYFNSHTLTHYPTKDGVLNKKVLSYINLWDEMCQASGVEYKLYGRHSFNAPYSHYAIMMSYFALAHPFLYWVERDNDEIKFDYKGSTYTDEELSDLICILCAAVNSTLKCMLSDTLEYSSINLPIHERNTCCDILATILTKGYSQVNEDGSFDLFGAISNFIETYKSLLNTFKTMYDKAANPKEAIKEFIRVMGNAVGNWQLHRLYTAYRNLDSDENAKSFYAEHSYNDIFSAYLTTYHQRKPKTLDRVNNHMYFTAELLADRANLFNSATDLYYKMKNPFTLVESDRIKNILDKTEQFKLNNKAYIDGTALNKIVVGFTYNRPRTLDSLWPSQPILTLGMILTFDAPLGSSVDYIHGLLRRRLLVISLFADDISLNDLDIELRDTEAYSTLLGKCKEVYDKCLGTGTIESALYKKVTTADCRYLPERLAELIDKNVKAAREIIESYISCGYDSRTCTTLSESELTGGDDIAAFEEMVHKVSNLLQSCNDSGVGIDNLSEADVDEIMRRIANERKMPAVLDSEEMDYVLKRSIIDVVNMMGDIVGKDLLELDSTPMGELTIIDKIYLSYIEKNGEQAYLNHVNGLLNELGLKNNKT